jgi:hypothetical protein
MRLWGPSKLQGILKILIFSKINNWFADPHKGTACPAIVKHCWSFDSMSGPLRQQDVP